MKTSLTAVYEPQEEGGFTAYIAEIPGATTQGETLEEARVNLVDALRLVWETRREVTLAEAGPGYRTETITVEMPELP